MDYEKLSDDRVGETSESIRKRVQAARNIQQQCFASSQSDIICNADMHGGEIRQFCKLLDEGDVLSLSKYQGLMRAAMTQLNLSARAYDCIPKLGRSITDLAGTEEIHSQHLAEAMSYRPRSWWSEKTTFITLAYHHAGRSANCSN